MTIESAPSDAAVAVRLAEWITAIDFESLPSDVVGMVKLMVLDQLGLQLKGATLPNVQPERRLVEAMQARPESTMTFSGAKTTAPYAAYVNAILGSSAEFDDAHRKAWHVGSCTVATGLAFAERGHCSGRDLVESIVAGSQVMSVLGAVAGEGMQTKGWHGSKVMGVFGTAAAASKLLDLPTLTTANALAIAGSDASGTMEYDQSGGEVKRLHAGSAARSGSQAALLAAHGLTGPLTIFEGKRGFFQLFAGVAEDGRMTELLQPFHILDTMFRFYPVVGTILAPLEAVQRLRDTGKFEGADVASIRVGMSQMSVGHGGSITRPSDAITAQFSLAFSIGLQFLRGNNAPEDYFEPSLWVDSEILAVADKVHPYAMSFDPGVPDLSAQVDVTLHDGRSYGSFQHGFHGHPDSPASISDIEQKFRQNVSGIVSHETADQIVDTVLGLDELADVSELTALLGA